MDFARNIVVLKVGTSSLVDNEFGYINVANVSKLATIVVGLKRKGFRVIIVSSGAVGAGAMKLGLKERPKSVPAKQALAAIGQGVLYKFWSDTFDALNTHTAQILLSYDNLSVNSQFSNARQTVFELLKMGVVPIINENDTVAVEEIKVGDNDTLSALVAACVGAHFLILLTDVDGLYTSNPRTDPAAKKIDTVDDVDELSVDVQGAGTGFGTGGMATKITAARIGTSCDCDVIIMNSKEMDRIPARLEGKAHGTLFRRKRDVVRSRKRWLLSCKPRGQVALDRGACGAVKRRNSLFAAGVKQVRGSFSPQDVVELVDADGAPFARAVVNFSSAEVDKIKGKRSSEFHAVLGYFGQEYVAHRDNICFYQSPSAE